MGFEPMTFSLEVSKIDGKNFDLGQYRSYVHRARLRVIFEVASVKLVRKRK